MDNQINATTFYTRLSHTYQLWLKEMEDIEADAMVLIRGKHDENDSQSNQTRTSNYQLYLLGYEFTESIIVISKKRIIFFLGSKKKSMLDSLPKTKNYNGPEIEFVIREVKASNEKAITAILNNLGPKIGLLTTEKGLGVTTEEFYNSFEALNKIPIDISVFMDKIFFVKQTDEIEYIKVSAKYSSYIANCTLKKIEKAIDSDKEVSNLSITTTIKEYTTKEPFLNRFKEYSKMELNTSLLEIGESCPIIQSGNTFDWNFGKPSNSNVLKASIIAIKTYAKYKEYVSKVIRTYMIDTDKNQMTKYTILLEAFDFLIKSLKPGTKLSEIYNKTVSFVKERSETEIKLHPVLGYGIGQEFNNKSLIIEESCRQKVQEGNVFYLNITFEDLKNDKGVKYWLQLGDTVLITNEGPKVLTDDVKKGANDIYYNMEVVEDQSEDVVDNKKNEMEIDEDIIKNNDRNAPITRTYVQKKKMEKNGGYVNDLTKRKEHQMFLLEKKNEELKERLEARDFGGENFQTIKIKPESIRAYQSTSSIPNDFKRGKIFVDLNHDVVLLPIFKKMIPIAGDLIKNVTKSTDGLYTYLRINFHTPITGTSNISFNEIANLKDPIFIKDLHFRSSDKKHFENVFKLINDMIKRLKAKEKEDKEKSNLIEQEGLQINRSHKRIFIDNVCLRPSFTGKSKTVGSLEAHINGFRFTSNKGEKMDFIYKNIKHAFYQPSEKELIVILHFTLKNPILVGKKKRDELQFTREVGGQSDDMKLKSRSDFEEYEQELKENMYKERVNKEFLLFTERIEEQNPQIQFDIPYRELAFEGAPFKSSLWLMPTVNALISLSDIPFFVLSLDEIELVYFERVSQSIRNFDIAIIFKNLNKPVHRISSVPATYLEMLKNWLDSVDILFTEGVAPINWVIIMNKIKKDPDNFIEEGCWNILHHEVEESEDDDSEEDGDPEFKTSEIEEEEESEYEEDEESEYSEESSYDDEEDLSEEGLSWEELGKQALKSEKAEIEKRASSPKRNEKKKRR